MIALTIERSDHSAAIQSNSDGVSGKLLDSFARLEMVPEPLTSQQVGGSSCHCSRWQPRQHQHGMRNFCGGVAQVVPGARRFWMAGS